MEVAEQTVDSGQSSADNAGSKSQSLSDAISAAISATREAKAEAPEAPAPDKDDAGVKETAGNERDGEDAGAAKDDASSKPKDSEAAPKGDAAQPVEAPKHWPEADRKAFAGLAPEAQAIVRRAMRDVEGGFTRKSQELGDKAKYADAVRSLIDNNTRQHLASTGANELQYFAHLHQMNELAKRDAPGFVRWAMNQLGLTPDRIFPAQQQPAQQQPAADAQLEALLSDPKVKHLETELAQLKGVVTQRQQAEWQAYQNQLAQHRSSLQHTAMSFRNAQDDSGQLAYPHFDQVHVHMGALMDADPRLAQMPDGPEKMQAAYDMAVHARPDLRQSLIEAEVAKRYAAAEKAREVARAKSVTAVKPAAGVSVTSAKPQSLSDIIREQTSRLGLG